MDGELGALCLVATKNALYRKLTSLMDQAKQTMVGIDYDVSSLYEVRSFGSRSVPAEMETWNLYTAWYSLDSVFGPDHMFSCGHRCWAEAFEDDRAQEIWLDGAKVFVKRDGEWLYVENVPS